jgi:hypothetical protein
MGGLLAAPGKGAIEAAVPALPANSRSCRRLAKPEVIMKQSRLRRGGLFATGRRFASSSISNR